MSKTNLTAQQVRELLDYDSTTGILRNRVDRYCGNGRIVARAGDIPGSPHRNGYWTITLNDEKYLAHRLAFLHHNGRWPEGQLDHKDRDKRNNRIGNLREATPAQNLANSVRRNKYGMPRGVRFFWGKYRVRMTIGGKEISLGSYETFEAAVAARQKAAREVYGEFEYDRT